LSDALRDSLDRDGWLQGLSGEQIDDLVGDHIAAIDMVCCHFEVGAVVGRRSSSVFIRALTAV
jgi:hypothetical protein